MTTEPNKPRRVVVYCGSAPGADPAYLLAETALGRALAEAGIGVVYGGANVGMMGAVADAALAADGEVIGVLPEILGDREIAHAGLTKLIFTETMHVRKAKMLELSDAVVALPGGYGTLDELMEAVTWAQLKIHTKPCILINILGYYDGLLSFLDATVEAGFLKPGNRKLIRVAPGVTEVLQILNDHLKWSKKHASSLQAP